MSFEQAVRVPLDRVAAVIGKKGESKKRLEEACHVTLQVDGESGEVTVRSSSAEEGDPFKAISVVEAVGRGFSPERALRLLEPENSLEVLDLRDFAGKSDNSLERIRGRIIGLNGKSRRVIEELTKCSVSVYGRTVAIIGEATEAKLAKEAITMLATGSRHRSVYNMLQRARTKQKMDRMLLWEDQSPEIDPDA
ncbi:MAG: KH domain-containing protein [Thaumarchaeota archaeon]|jgi:ribosomal RNA assembly protein|nr:KH domain-containing protein [Nitrososphaerota archaeon]MDA4136543.1 KH domain-containing protein [Nitrososphaerota archaeon]